MPTITSTASPPTALAVESRTNVHARFHSSRNETPSRLHPGRAPGRHGHHGAAGHTDRGPGPKFQRPAEDAEGSRSTPAMAAVLEAHGGAGPEPTRPSDHARGHQVPIDGDSYPGPGHGRYVRNRSRTDQRCYPGWPSLEH